MTTSNQFLIKSRGLEIMNRQEHLIQRWRSAVSFCKIRLSIPHERLTEIPYTYENAKRIERCIIENYLEKYGWDYFGKRDILYMDMIPNQQVTQATTGYTNQA